MHPTSSMEPGRDTPLGRYRLIALLGQGGMADVYLACTQGPRNFTKLLVVKLARFTGEPMFATMFLEEARLAAQLSHPNIVQTNEIGEEGTRHYIVMEYLDGGVLSRLRQRMAKRGGIPLRTSLSIMMQVLDGLEYAHEARGIDGRELKVVHRDLSPSNIMVTVQGVVKILDFGIAKAADSQGFTQTGKFSGKLAYMPPEQLRGERVDARADIFSAGVILAECALNQKLWSNALDPEIASKLGQGLIPSLEREGKQIDPELRRICEKALAPDRNQRYATTAELKTDLSAYLQTLGGPVSQKELAEFVKTTIEEDRAKLQTVIDTQLARISSPTWQTPLPGELPRVDSMPISRSKSPVQLDETVKNEIVLDDDEKRISISQPIVHPPAPASKSKLIGAAVAALVIVFGIIAFVVMRNDRKPTEAAKTPAPPVQTPPAAQMARVEVVVSPSEAQLFLDAKPLGQNPYVGMFPRDGQVHSLEIRAPGYRTLTQQIAIDRDLNFRLSLERELAQAPVGTSITTDPGAKPAETPVTKTTKKQHVTHVVTTKKTTATPAGSGTGSATQTVTTTTTPPPDTTKKTGLETDPYSKKTKRTLDTDVIESGSNKSKNSIDRDNPWKK